MDLEICKQLLGGVEMMGRALYHTHMFFKCSNVLLFYCRCITEMKFNNLLYTTSIKQKRFSALLFIMAVQMSLDYSACVHGQISTCRDSHKECSREWSLLKNLHDTVPLLFSYQKSLLSQMHINTELKWVPNKREVMFLLNHTNPLLKEVF